MGKDRMRDLYNEGDAIIFFEMGGEESWFSAGGLEVFFL